MLLWEQVCISVDTVTHKTQSNPSAHICALHLLHFILVITTPSVIRRKKVIKTKGTGLWVHCIRGDVTQLKVLVNISEIGFGDATCLLRGSASQKLQSTMAGQLSQSLGQYRGLSPPCPLQRGRASCSLPSLTWRLSPSQDARLVLVETFDTLPYKCSAPAATRGD